MADPQEPTPRRVVPTHPELSSSGLASAAPGVRFPAETLVLIPALNEADGIAATIGHWRALGFRRVRVVDNGSEDETAAIARGAGAEVCFEAQRGYGAAAWRGLQAWPSDVSRVLFSAADGSDQLSESELVAWQRAIDSGADLVTGDRVTRPESRRELKPIQRLGNWVTSTAIDWLWGRKFQDMGALRLALHHKLIELELKDRAFGWNVEMQVRALESGWQVTEVPVCVFPRRTGKSKISGSFMGSFRAGIGILRMLAILGTLRFYRRRREAHPHHPGSTR